MTLFNALFLWVAILSCAIQVNRCIGKLFPRSISAELLNMHAFYLSVHNRPILWVFMANGAIAYVVVNSVE